MASDLKLSLKDLNVAGWFLTAKMETEKYRRSIFSSWRRTRLQAQLYKTGVLYKTLWMPQISNEEVKARIPISFTNGKLRCGPEATELESFKSSSWLRTSSFSSPPSSGGL